MFVFPYDVQVDPIKYVQIPRNLNMFKPQLTSSLPSGNLT